MNTPCRFNRAVVSFEGEPFDQARCLLRFVKKHGNADDVPAVIPPTLTTLLQNVGALTVAKDALRRLLAARSIAESAIGGSLDERVSRANDDDPAARSANYFVIHDTSTALAPGQTFDPTFINSAEWSGNRITGLSRGKTHVYINRLGQTLTDREYKIPWRATQFELHHIGTPAKGLFLHHELVQPRLIVGGSDADAPTPGFTADQYDMLAICYLAASVRRGQWLIPAFHCVLDLVISGGHDDPQNFDLIAWDAALGTLLGLLGTALQPRLTPTLKHPLLAADLDLQQVAAGNLILHAPEPTRAVRVPGIASVQDAFNHLAARSPDLGIALGAGNINRGFFGPHTRLALERFRASEGMGGEPQVDQPTVLNLDTRLLEFDAEPGTAPDEHPIDISHGEEIHRARPGFEVPSKSAPLLKGIDFDTAESVGANFVEKFATADKGSDSSRGIKDAHRDPSLCRQILRFPDGTIFFSAKMAIDSDGSPRAGAMDDTGDPNTSQRYLDKKRTSINAEEVPYFVLPQFDKFAKEDFISDLGLKLGDYGVVIHNDKITGAFVADEGPFYKIGEASIRVHELLEPPPAPWKTAAKKRIRDASVERDVLYFVFPRTVDMEGLTPANAEKEVTSRAMVFFDRLKRTGSHV